MGVLCVSFRSKVWPKTFGCVAMGSEVLFILRSRLLLYSAGSGVNRVQVLSGCSVVFCPGKNFMYVWFYIFLGFTRACVCRCEGNVIYIGDDLKWCSGWWYVCNLNIE